MQSALARLAKLAHKSSVTSAYVTNTKKLAQNLYLQNWQLVYSQLPQTVFSDCPDALACIQSDYTGTLSTYDSNAQKLFTLAKKTAKKLSALKSTAAQKAAARYLKMAEATLKQSLQYSGGFPKTSQTCTIKK